jgi:hypothetical protein
MLKKLLIPGAVFVISFFYPDTAFSQAPVIQWQNIYGGASFDEATLVKPTSDGNFILVGSTISSDNDVSTPLGNFDIWAVKVSPVGEIIWKTNIGSPKADIGTSVDNTQDGGYIIAGYSDSSKYGQKDYYLIKLDGAGSVQWEKRYGGSGNDLARSVSATSDGGYILAGMSNSINGEVRGNYGNYDYWVLKLDATGDTVWTKNFGGSQYDEARSVSQTLDGGYIIAGHSYSANRDLTGKNNGLADYWVVKTDPAGVISWSMNYGGTSDDFASSVRETSDGGYIIAGTSFSSDVNVTGHLGDNTKSDFWIVKTDVTGAISWEKSYGGNQSDGANDIQETSDNGFIVAGFTLSMDVNVTGNHGLYDYWVIKLDGAGSLTWEKTAGGTEEERANSITEAPDGGFLVAGFTRSSNGDVTRFYGDRDYWLVKLGGDCIKPGSTFTLSPAVTSICPQTRISFLNQTQGNITAYQWQINNVNYSAARDTSHLFTTPGTYTVRLIAYKGAACSDSLDTTITVNPIPAVPTITSSSGSFSYCSGDSIILSSSPNTAYQWYKNGQLIAAETNQDITVKDLSSSSYKVVVTNSNGCTNTSPATFVTVNPLPSSTLTIYSLKDSVCTGDSLQLLAPEGYTYSWITAETTRSIYVDTAGTYYVTITTAAGCSRTLPGKTIKVNPLLTPAITASVTSFCYGDSATITATSGYSTYLWSNGKNTSSIRVKQAGTYQVTVTDNKGCKNSSNTETITVNPLPVVSITAGCPRQFCQGDSVVFTSSPYDSYQWFRNGAVIPGANLQDHVAKTSGVYQVRVTDANGCSGFSGTDTVKVNPLPNGSLSVFGGDSICPGDSVRISARAGYTYVWSNSATTQAITVSSSGQYYSTVSLNGCSVVSDTVTIKMKPKPNVTISSGGSPGPIAFCSGSSAVLSPSGAFSKYFWSTGAATQNINVFSAGTYYLRVRNASGCMSDTSNKITVTVNPIPTVNITSSTGQFDFCAGGSTTLTAIASGTSNTFSWSTGSTSNAITVSTGGSYKVTVTGFGGCTNKAEANIIVHPLPATPKIYASGPTTFCEGQSVALRDSSNEPNASYLWSNGVSGPFLNVNQSGTYYEIVTTPFGCSAVTNSITVTVKPRPVVSITAGGATTFCKGRNVTLSTNATFTKYLWSNMLDTTQNIVVTRSGSYFVEVTASNGCRNTSNTINVTVLDPPSAVSVTADGPTRFCNGGSVVLRTGSPYSSYKWSNNDTVSTITVEQSGTYKVTVTNSAGCSAVSSSMTVTVDSVPPVPTITQAQQLLTSSSNYGNQWYFNGTSLDSAGIYQTYFATQSGIYKVVVTNVYGCSAESAPVNVTVKQNSIEENPAVNNLKLYPNPFSESISLRYELKSSAIVSIELYNLLGERVETLLGTAKQNPGNYEFSWNPDNGLKAGTYLLNIKVNDKTSVHRIVKL